MIKYNLQCKDCGARFDQWFTSMSAYDTEKKENSISCQSCKSTNVVKSIMAPNVSAASAAHNIDRGGVSGGSCASCPAGGTCPAAS